MIFQTFDDKQECFMVYKEASFHRSITHNCTHTWSYASYLKDEEVEYASLYVLGSSLKDMCNEQEKEAYEALESRIKAVIASCYQVNLDLNRMCVYEVMPRHLLAKWAEMKNKICSDIFNNLEKPNNYDQLLKINKVIADIKQKRLNLDLSKIIQITVQDKNTYKLICSNKPYVDYDMTKTITGRLSTKKGSFPVMTLARKYRNILIPNNDWLFEMDFNACELRLALALLGYDQPEEDLHEWNLNNVFQRSKSRDNAKKRIFSWLYNPNSDDEAISKVYDREKLKTLYYKDNKVTTPFGRVIECDEDHAVNYLVQSTAADLVFEQMYKVWEFLRDKKSFIKFCNHDSIMIDLHTEQEYEFNEIKELFSNTRFGKFKVNCLGGKNWAEMKELYIK